MEAKRFMAAAAACTVLALTLSAAPSVRAVDDGERMMDEHMDEMEDAMDEMEDQMDEAEHGLEQARERAVIHVPKGLEVAAQAMADQDENVIEIEADEEDMDVSVSYRLRAKLFGFIDVPYELEARVDREHQEVKAHGPWWLLFARDNAGDVQTALEADETLLTATNQGQVLSTILDILRSLAR